MKEKTMNMGIKLRKLDDLECPNNGRERNCGYTSRKNDFRNPPFWLRWKVDEIYYLVRIFVKLTRISGMDFNFGYNSKI
jgi:hypothetical protein